MTSSSHLGHLWAYLEEASTPWVGLIATQFGDVEKNVVLTGNLNRGLMIVTSSPPPSYPQFDAVKVEAHQNPEGRWVQVFELLESSHKDEFSQLCSDMLLASEGFEDERPTQEAMLDAYVAWLDFYKSSRKISMEVLRGLIGELLFLRDCVIPRLGASDALSAWQGPMGNPQDFVMPSFHAFEIKTLQPSVTAVKISSKNQLDFAGELTLVLYRLTNSSQPMLAVSAKSLIEELSQTFDVVDLKKFHDRLGALGIDIDEPKLSQHNFSYLEPVFYSANSDDFPKLTNASISPHILSATYEIQISGLEPYALTEPNL